MQNLSPAARAAQTALDAFGAVTPRQARILIGYWARRDELDATDVEAVLATYERQPVVVAYNEFERDNSMPEGQALPDHVDGTSISGRADR